MADLSSDTIGNVEPRGAVILVTGAASGIGRATARLLAARGATVVAIDRDGAALTRLASEAALHPITADVSEPAHADRVVAETMAHHNRLDAVVANAGIGYVGDFATMPAETISQLIDVNVRAPMLLARAALPLMLAQKHGALIFTTSIAGTVPVPFEATYCSSKTALEAFADALREEVRPAGVTVSTVRPGVVRTAFHEQRNAAYSRRFPRPVEPDQVAAAIVAVIESGAARRTVPSWLEAAAQARARLPWAYRAIARRLGGA